MDFRKILSLGKGNEEGKPPEVEKAEPQAKEQAVHIDRSGLAKQLSIIATNWWKASERISAEEDSQEDQVIRRLRRNIDGIGEALEAIGLQVKDRVGEPYDYGYPEKVIAFEPADGITREMVKETIRPSVFWDSKLIQTGEIAISTPSTKGKEASKETKNEEENTNEEKKDESQHD